jgi:pyridoxal phosphate enzyme (YggS family)
MDSIMTIQTRIASLQSQINALEKQYHRAADSVQLLAVSKGRTCDDIQTAHAAGLNHFGESYLQEAQIKINTLQLKALCWHFIGPIQRNKTKGIAQSFSWVHSVSRHTIAERLHTARPSTYPPLQICIQINLEGELQKSGVSADEAFSLAEYIKQLPKLQLRGLMYIPPADLNKAALYATYSRLQGILDAINEKHQLTMDTLSIGMTNDLEEAIHAGSTIVRVGRGIFGT